MDYCPDCMRLREKDRCPICGRKTLMAPQPGDLCFLEEQDVPQDMIRKALRKGTIDEMIARCRRE